MMGSGKSYWAGKLGHYFSLPAYDLDRLLESASGKTIARIFEEEGEEAFRKMESGMLRSGVPASSFILASGGGTPCFYENMEYMKTNGIVVWLNPGVDELVRRLNRGIDSRPVLEGIKSPEALKNHLQNLMEKRISWYRQAHIVIDDDASLENITGKIALFENG